MRKIAVITDPHINRLSKKKVKSFIENLYEKDFQGLLITGDLSTGLKLKKDLEFVLELWSRPLYFIHGNHDIHFTTFKEVDLIKKETVYEYCNFVSLDDGNICKLNENTCLIGESGWFDARWQKPLTHLIFSPEWWLINDFRIINNHDCLQLARDISSESSEKIGKSIKESIRRGFKEIHLATHFPPWPQGLPNFKGIDAVYKKLWIPYCTSRAIADTIAHIMSDNEDINLIVHSGHTHWPTQTQIAKNIKLIVGEAKVGEIVLDHVIEY